MESETNNVSLITLVLNVQIIMCHQNELRLVYKLTVLVSRSSTVSLIVSAVSLIVSAVPLVVSAVPLVVPLVKRTVSAVGPSTIIASSSVISISLLVVATSATITAVRSLTFEKHKQRHFKN